jgi:hypothetical protein
MTIYEEANRYVKEFDWAIVRLPYKTKGNTMESGWNDEGAGLKTEAELSVLNRELSNIGLHHLDSGTVAIDIDDEAACRMLFSDMGLDYDELFGDAPRIVSRPGRDKAIFRRPESFKHIRNIRVLKWPSKDVPGALDVVFEIRSFKCQDVLPPSIHPDTDAPYTWGRHPENGIPELPAQLVAIWNEWDIFEPQLKSACPWGPKVTVKPKPAPRNTFGNDRESVIERYNQTHDIRNLLSQYGYEKKGMRFLAPYSKTKVPGVIVYSIDNVCFSHHGTDVLGDGHSHDCFDLFCRFEHDGDYSAAVKSAAAEMKMQPIEYDPDAIEHGKQVANSFLKKNNHRVEDDLTKVPGVLGLAVQYYQSTALKPQPEYAVASALAIGAVCLSRQWKTNQNNYSALYFLMLGKSSTGKEHGKTVIETVLRASGDICLNLIGPPGYTSAGAIITTLKKKPRHICIQDEMGKQLQHAMSSKNSQKDAAYTMIMEAFGRQAGFLSSDAYSNLSGKHQDEETSTIIDRPGITIFGISTPSTLYKAINTDSISSGYLPRFLIIESTAERELGRWIEEETPVPEELIAWCRRCAEATGESGNLSAYTNPPEPRIVQFSPACRVMLEEFEREIINIQNGLDMFSMSELYGRVKEIAMRVSLTVAVSCESEVILPEHLDWAMRYVKKHFQNITMRVKQVVSNSDYEAVCKEVLTIIQKTGVRGATTRDIYKKSALFRGVDKKSGEAILSTLECNFGVELKTIEHVGAGRRRVAWVYPEEGE